MDVLKAGTEPARPQVGGAVESIPSCTARGFKERLKFLVVIPGCGRQVVGLRRR